MLILYYNIPTDRQRKKNPNFNKFIDFIFLSMRKEEFSYYCFLQQISMQIQKKIKIIRS